MALHDLSLNHVEDILISTGKIWLCNIKTYPNVVDKELFEAIRTDMTATLLCTITNVGHLVLTFEPPPYPVVNTLGFAPASLEPQAY